MITGLQLATASGGLVAAGVAVAVAAARPGPVRLDDALRRLRPATRPATTPGQRPDVETRIGAWAERYLPGLVWGSVPEADLAILGRSRATFYGSKVLTAAIGLVIGPLLAVLAALLGLRLPFAVPVAGSIGLAAVMWSLPGNELKDKAARARAEFSHALGAFVEMVALERLSGSGVPQALQHAADIGDSWPFQRIAATLRRTQYTGHNPWDALDDLGAELELQQLGDLADIMRLAGTDGTQIYDSLRARGAAMRHGLLNEHISQANRAGERIAIPVGLLVFILAITLITPAFLRML